MDKYTPEKMREAFVYPLSEILSDLTKASAELEKQHKSGVLANDYLPLNDGYALRAILDLKKFLRAEVKPKLEGAIDGSFRFREAELKFSTGKRRKKPHH